MVNQYFLAGQYFQVNLMCVTGSTNSDIVVDSGTEEVAGLEICGFNSEVDKHVGRKSRFCCKGGAGGRRQCRVELFRFTGELSCFVPAAELSCFVHVAELSCFLLLS
ncbi:hypothetical protein TNCV_2351681 [Trichonephila clavipes]|nr:hypothetical protein TNCV_2351681 [Trichonephila clavipes]